MAKAKNTGGKAHKARSLHDRVTTTQPTNVVQHRGQTKRGSKTVTGSAHR